MHRALALFLVLAVGCGNSATAPSQTTPPSKTANTGEPAVAEHVASMDASASESVAPATAEFPPLPEAGLPVVTLLDPGAEPRKPLRYAWKKAVESFVLDLKMSFTVKQGSLDSPVTTLPMMRIGVRVQPKSVGADGTLAAIVDVTKIDVLGDDPLPEDIKQKLVTDAQKLVGLKVGQIVTSYGVVEKAELVPSPAGMPRMIEVVDALEESLRSLATPVPEEAVGKNSRWKVTTITKAKFTSVQTTTFTLKERTEKQLVVDVSIAQTAPRQPRTGPGVPAGATMTIESAEGTGSSEQTFTLDRLSPTAWKRKLELKTVTMIAAGDRKFPVTTTHVVDTVLKPAR